MSDLEPSQPFPGSLVPGRRSMAETAWLFLMGNKEARVGYSIVFATLFLLASPYSVQAFPASHSPNAEKSRLCLQRAGQIGRSAVDRRKAHAACRRELPGVKQPDTQAPRTRGGKEITSPSGVSPAIRADQCNAQALKMGLRDAAMQAFQKSCVASEAPVSNVGVGTLPPKPTPANKSLGNPTQPPP